MSSPDGTYQWLSLAAAIGVVIALLLLIWTVWTLRKLRRAQKIVLGDGTRDIADHAASMQREFIALRDWLDETSDKLGARMSHAENRLDGTIAHTAMIRYDAYNEMSGRQSSSVALLDEHHNGVVLSAITHRSHSHLYVKNITAGVSDIELSPEERRVIEKAFIAPDVRPPEPKEAPPITPITAKPASPQHRAQQSGAEPGQRAGA